MEKCHPLGIMSKPECHLIESLNGVGVQGDLEHKPIDSTESRTAVACWCFIQDGFQSESAVLQ